MKIFEDFQLEELIALLKNFKKAIDRTGTTTVSGWINYLCTMLCGVLLRGFDKLASQNNITTNLQLKSIQEGLLMYFPPKRGLKTEAWYVPLHSETPRGAF